MKCWNLERVINAELFVVACPENELTLENLLEEEGITEAIIASRKDGECIEINKKWRNLGCRLLGF